MGTSEMLKKGSRLPVWARIAIALMCACLILSANTLYSRFLIPNGIFGEGLFALAIVLTLILCLGLWISAPIEGRMLHRWLVWASFVCVTYSVCWFSHAQAGGHALILWAAALMTFPLLLGILAGRGRLDRLWCTFSTEAVVLAASSLVLWILGPVGGMIGPNCSIESLWVPSGGVAQAVPGYYWLLFQAQQTSLAGVALVRNTGIFTEAPMYSYVLCSALLCEACLCKRPRTWVVSLLTLAIVTTFSATGYVVVAIVLVGTAVLPWMGRVWHSVEGSRGKRSAVALFFCLCALCVASIAWAIVSIKLGSFSGSDRADVMQAGFRAWLQSPLLGNGLNSERAIAALRTVGGRDLGLSNSLAVVLALGGLVFLALYAVPVVGMLHERSWRLAVYAIALCAMWSVTVTYDLALTALLFSVGACELICSGVRNRGNQCDCDGKGAVTLHGGIRVVAQHGGMIAAVCGASALLMLAAYPLLPHVYGVTDTIVLDGAPTEGIQPADAVEDLRAMVARDDVGMEAIGQTRDKLYGRYNFGVSSDVEGRAVNLYVEGPSPASVAIVANYIAKASVAQYAAMYPAPVAKAAPIEADEVALVDDRVLYASATLVSTLLVSLAMVTRDNTSS